MKNTTSSTWMASCLSVLIATAGVLALADEPATTANQTKQVKTYNGIVTAVDGRDHVVMVKGTLFAKQFNLGDNCAYALLERQDASANDLRPGQKVRVTYQEARGVPIAERIEQQPMRYEGMAKAINAEKRTLTLRARGLNREFQIGEDCIVALRNNRTGTLQELSPGQHLTVTYELPGGDRMARRIAQTSITMEGVVTALDLTERTMKAKSVFGSRKYHLSRDCAIVVNGKTDVPLGELRLGDRIEITYDEVNGVNIANRIAPTKTAPSAVTAQTLER